MKSETRSCQNCKKDFLIAPEDFDFYDRIKVPPPTWCPQCRLMRRLEWRNERALYRRTCDLCKQSVISVYSPDKPFKVYCPSCYHSDKWDPLSYGREYDFSRPFFEQFRDLQLDIPHLGLLQISMVNSPWCNYENHEKNCYLNVGGEYNEDSAYTQYGLKTKNSLDNYWIENAEFCYETSFATSCHKVFYSRLCYDCRDTYFSFDCRNCANVIGCSGLRHKQNYIFNKPVSKEEFEAFVRENINGSYAKLGELKQKALADWKRHPQRALFIDRSRDCTGNLISESKKCESCWITEKTENSKYQIFNLGIRDSYDVTAAWNGELMYEFMSGSGNTASIKFSITMIDGSSNNEYCQLMFDCHDCFGSMNIGKQKYCILNKQYDKEEYEDLTAKIRQHMMDMPYTDSVGRTYRYGEFLPLDLSPFAYNETVAFEYFPLSEAEAKQRGVKWNKYEGEAHQFSGYAIPDNIGDVGNDILDKTLKCEISGKAYRLIPMELEFYRQFNVPVPRVSPFERHKERVKFVSDHLELRDRICGRCNKNIRSVYTADEFPIVYCEECYIAEVV